MPLLDTGKANTRYEAMELVVQIVLLYDSCVIAQDVTASKIEKRVGRKAKRKVQVTEKRDGGFILSSVHEI
jgi:hypothetical protein